jgi:hypothetical protein
MVMQVEENVVELSLISVLPHVELDDATLKNRDQVE